MPTGHYQRKPRVERQIITCAQCGKQREFLPGFLRIHPTRFCSTACAGLATRKPEAYQDLVCGPCGSVFRRLRAHMKKRNFCSKECSDIGRRVPGARWRNPDRIKEYMRQYVAANRDRVNAKSRERATRNRDQRRAVQARYRERNKAAIKRLAALRRTAVRSGTPATVSQIDRLFKRAHGRCVYCGLVRPLTLDHVTALTKNGTHERNNLLPVCKSCNSRKNNRDAVEWVFQSFGVQGLGRALMFLEGKRIPPQLYGEV